MAAAARRLLLILACAVVVLAPVAMSSQARPATQQPTIDNPDAIRTDQPTTETPEELSTVVPADAEEPTPYNPLDTYSFYLTALFMGFGLVVILLQLALMRRIATITADEIARNCAITMVVVASVALLVSGYSSQQVAPAFGLFGTIIGYLLGKAGREENKDVAPTEKP